ncbi:MAG TPA: NHL repeat-containing protein [Solirubrobacterales bacterium]|nr:NHL repeat-containing protein [Solirubrobacterales bacterium]
MRPGRRRRAFAGGGRFPQLRILAVAIAALIVTVAPARAIVEGEAPLGTPGSLPGQLSGPTGVTQAFDGNIYVANTGNDRIEVFARDGSTLPALGGPGSGPGQFSQPSSVYGLAAEPSLLVLEAGNNRVQKLSLSGAPVAGFNGPSGAGSLPGSFNAPQSITADVDGRFWVADTNNNRVQAFGADGTYLETIGEGALSRPRGVALGLDGTLYVSDSGHNQIVAYPPGAAKNGPGTQVVGPGTLPGQVQDPGGIAVDALGRLDVADSGNARVEQFATDGTYLESFRGEGSARLRRPEGIFVTPRGDLLVADSAAGVVVRARETLPPPVAGKSANITKTAGQVFVTRPRSRRPEPLDQSLHIPVGTTVDTRKGAVRIESARSTKPRDTQIGNAFDGRFIFRQPIHPKVVTNLVLTGGSFATCSASTTSRPAEVAGASGSKEHKAKDKPKREIRRLWGNAHGPTETTGANATAADKGTEWLTVDYCNGTLVRVTQGVVFVLPLRGSAKPIRVTAGNQVFVPSR